MAPPNRLLGALVSTLLLSSVSAITLPSSYDVVWASTGVNQSADSMPVGGGDIGINAWSENGTLLFYLGKSGTFDENNAVLKLGRLRLTLDPNPFATGTNGTFEQRLLTNDGYVRFTGADNTTVNVWVDVFNPVVHLDVDSPDDKSVTLAYESWRYENRTLRGEERNQGSWGFYTSKVPNGTTYADTIGFQDDAGGVLAWHRNEKLDLFDFQVQQQGLAEHADTLYNPMRNNEFGVLIESPDLVPGNVTTGHYINTTFKAWNLVSSGPKKAFRIPVVLHQNQTASHEEWLDELTGIAAAASNNSQAATLDWWHAYWDRSYIIINEDAGPEDAGFTTGKNYQLWRYIMGTNARGEWPTKFNGGLFTFDPVLVNPSRTFTPDHRRWGGGTFTAQNQRLLYWPMLRTGDLDALRAQLDFYARITPAAVLRGQVYDGLDRAAEFLEQGDNTGLSNVYEYNGQWYDDELNVPRPSFFPPGELWNTWINQLHDTANEFADMALQAALYSPSFDVAPYLPFVEAQLAFFDQYYQKQQLTRTAFPLSGYNGNETLVLFPASGAETYKEAYNPSSTVSGLRKVITDLLAVGKFAVRNASYYEGYLKRIPETPLRIQQGRTTIAPALAWSRIQNTEPIQLYPVFPWGEYGLGRPNNTFAIDTYLYDTETQAFHGNIGWKQDVIWLARMGLTANATAMTIDRFADSKVCKFPVFKGPNFDWTPDLNHFGVAALGLHEQLIHTFVDDDIRLLPSWPAEWDVRFKVHAPRNTTVEAVVKGGNVTTLAVVPESRTADVIYGQA